MEVLQHTSLRTDDLDSSVSRPGESEWLPPSHSALQQSSSSESIWLPPSLSSLMWSSSDTGSGEVGPFPPAPVPEFLRSSSSSESGNSKCPSFELRCLANLGKAYLPVPPPPAPARAINGFTKKRHVLRARPKVILEQSEKFANGALEHYNKNKKAVTTHVNFTAKSSKEGSPEQLFFAELHNCGKARAPSGFVVTFCEPLGSDTTVGHKGFELHTKAVRKDMFCFGCSPRIHHPKGGGYVAGHCNVPDDAYDSTCYVLVSYLEQFDVDNITTHLGVKKQNN